jgi:hypothetical protein
MEKLVQLRTNMTPDIVLDKSEAIFTIKGSSRPENPHEYYKPVFDWFKDYFTQPNEKTILELQFDYFNTSTSKILLDLFELFENHSTNGIDLHVKWYYENDDEEMMEAGEELLNLVEISYEVIGVEI